ncbi:thrombomodulin-like [Chaetodon auriga]|uniref:thrombomodulin-like n=1 Tax=Chaetodon auriga TaxID=39042 RepID=UPI004032B390
MLSFQSSFGSSNTDVFTTILNFPNVDMMTWTTHAVLLAVLFLCGLDKPVRSQLGHCTGSQCFALFQKPGDFEGAQKSCKDSGGQLFVFSLTKIETILTSLPSGFSRSFWLEQHSAGGPTEEAATGPLNCSSISMLTGRNYTLLWKPCQENLDGYLCQYTFEEPCNRLQAVGGTQVKYTAFMGFEVKDSETFPPGTIAVAEKVGAKHPESKHVCFSRDWMRAPWSCEVLQGGCEHNCNSTTHTCICPAGQTLHPNKITCDADPCADCEQECPTGYRLAKDRRSCVDINECEEEDPCTGEGEECKNTQGAFQCICKDGFEAEDGVCVNVTICERCEHMLCDKFNGVYECVCRKGFKVSPKDPTKCEMHCTERDCPARCIPNTDNEMEGIPQCFCPDGYILDTINNTAICSDINECEQEKPCDHKCENTLGSFRCLCDEGFKLYKEYMCVPIEEEEEEEGSGSSTPYPTPAGTHPVTVPSYIKTGSILSITMFMVLCAALLFFIIQYTARRCGKFELSTFKHPNMDILYLQQVTTETYKRLSFDKPFKNDSQILQSH